MFCIGLRTEKRISYQVNVTRTLFELRSDNRQQKFRQVGSLAFAKLPYFYTSILPIRQIPVDFKTSVINERFSLGQLILF